MYVCICNPTTDSQIIECCQDNSTLKELTQNLNICTNCMNCSKEISRIFKQHSPRMINHRIQTENVK